MKQANKELIVLVLVVAVVLIAEMSLAATWYDDFDDAVVDLTNYEVVLHPGGGVAEPNEPDASDPGIPDTYLEFFLNNPGGDYVLTAVNVELGDTVRTKFWPASYWSEGSCVIGLTYDPDATRLVDWSSASFFIQGWRANVRAYRHVDPQEEVVAIDGVGNPWGNIWVYDMAVGQDNGDGTFNIVLGVYGADGTLFGSHTFTTSTPTGNLHWFIGDNRSLSRVLSLEIGSDLGPVGPDTCADVIAGGGYLQKADLNGDCRVNLSDLAYLTTQWLECVDPEDPTCDRPWEQQ